jgi:hypothetical protein
MKFLRVTARWAALLAGIASVLFGAYIFYWRIGIYYYTYKPGLALSLFCVVCPLEGCLHERRLRSYATERA